MKILMISSYLPFPLYSGGQVRLYNLIKELSNKNEITLICEKRANQTQEDINEVEKICKKVITFDRRKQWSVNNIFNAGTSSQSFLATGHTLPMMRIAIQQALDTEKYDLIHVETYYVAHNIPHTNVPVVLIEHNIEYKVYEKYSQRLPVFAIPLLKIDIDKIRKEEESLWKRVKNVVVVSEEDRSVISKLGIAAHLVPNGVNTEEFSFVPLEKRNIREKKILFIGDYKWIQNQDSIRFIVNDIWPKLQSKAKSSNLEIKLWVVGREIPGWVKNLSQDPDIIFDQESSAKSTPEIFQEASVLLAPIRVGGGTSYKILEAMSCGTPVITMPMSAEAIHAKDNDDILVGQTAEELASKTVQILTDQDMYQKISANARKLIEASYTWKEIAKELDAVYHKTAR